ncbi:helix-turn-helix domain-containing protein [Olsenella sp. YH-ols2217]|uniref:Helix-turn-helix domain-containing protein n=1 Tax=Kribbibacterium absianum TaxID=3044210 RepID=A0ABT6ZLA1_9ACTN|nr:MULTISPECIES: helix-turn-helix domain-containing protein [unclassified Olsenella]MDJ1121822.1 helix-turn-helix domain-containing protein [Olsenella sp. YH-ols2216]MDJ1129830.1 helix-turn-helix domain-containing protein [Olsenella sp. YH-ols2217]
MTLGKKTQKNQEATKTITLKELEHKEMLDLHDVAALLGVSHRKVQRMVHDDEIPAYRVGCTWRVPRETLCRQYGLGEFAKSHPLLTPRSSTRSSAARRQGTRATSRNTSQKK